MTTIEAIRQLDAQLLVAGERLARYREAGGTSLIVQRGVCDRLPDDRLALMAKRDGP